MATTKTMKIVRGLAGKDATVFNDKLADGTRSIKVWRWRTNDYLKAKEALEQAGLKVRLVQFDKYSERMGLEFRRTRLHVEE